MDFLPRWNGPPRSSEVTERLSVPEAWLDFTFLNLLVSVDFKRLSDEAYGVQQALSKRLLHYRWPIFVAEVDGRDAFRLALFAVTESTRPSALLVEASGLTPTVGGRMTDLVGPEWALVCAEAAEVAAAQELELVEQDAEGRGWIVVRPRSAGQRTPEVVRELRRESRKGLSAYLAAMRGSVGCLLGPILRFGWATTMDDRRRFQQVIDCQKEWQHRFRPPTAGELAAAVRTIAEVRAIHDEMSGSSADHSAVVEASGRSRPGGPLR